MVHVRRAAPATVDVVLPTTCAAALEQPDANRAGHLLRGRIRRTHRGRCAADRTIRRDRSLRRTTTTPRCRTAAAIPTTRNATARRARGAARRRPALRRARASGVPSARTLMRSRRPTPCSPAIVARLSISSMNGIVTPLMPTAAPRSNSISTCAGRAGVSSRRLVILKNASPARSSRHRRGGRWCGPTCCRRPGWSRPRRPGRARSRSRSPRRTRSPERRDRASRSAARGGGDRARSRRARRRLAFSIRAISTSFLAISGRLSAVAIG